MNRHKRNKNLVEHELVILGFLGKPKFVLSNWDSGEKDWQNH